MFLFFENGRYIGEEIKFADLEESYKSVKDDWLEEFLLLKKNG